MNDTTNYEVVVVGAGHAGIEAAYAAARLGRRTLLLAMNLDSVGFMPCNPSVGGSSKGHLVKELDALGGLMPRETDGALVQLRTLHGTKGASVQSPRAQVDKAAYHRRIKHTLEATPCLTLRQDEAATLRIENGRVTGVTTVTGLTYTAAAVVLCCGVYLNATVYCGTVRQNRGPSGFCRAERLAAAVEAAGHALRRFKTGTPPRIDGKTVDYTKLQRQDGEAGAPLSVRSAAVRYDAMPCWLGYTNEKTHNIIRENLHKAPGYAGILKGTGARYCPSIEDKIVRFADKTRHQFFLEPEGEDTDELYVQGLSTGLPPDVQLAFLRSVKGLENVVVMRDAYAIEYDCIDPLTLTPALMSKYTAGLFFAGQLNGTSGYEEAAAQGLMAGLNAARLTQGLPPVTLKRSDAYIGVLTDDLVTKGTNEPYRMMTSRAEYRLTLRADNADLRLTPRAREWGLIDDVQWAAYEKRAAEIARVRALLPTVLPPKLTAPLLAALGEPPPKSGMTAEALFKRSAVEIAAIRQFLPLFADFSEGALSEVITAARYGGYLERQERQIA
ncbi:MAG: tRNA uridine-5-carboxymethylaminomethyl(34) synthesis enzyme MnmG, partial [Clostridiales bacterium]|nr:tRNA uridine-5-carboxymethylaminomethyl(34) synthesis enzyme MnmG [Clostridiales bacterium]